MLTHGKPHAIVTPSTTTTDRAEPGKQIKSSNMKLVAITTANAQWAGMAPAVAGGWVMTCPVAGMAVENGNVTGIYEKLAAVPDSWSGGRPVDAANVVTVLEHAVDRTERRKWKPESKAQDADTLRLWIARVQAVA